MTYRFNSERLAYWYLRLNGFLTIENFIVHDEGGQAQRTDVDLVAFRFQNRREAFREDGENANWMADDPRFADKRLPFAAFVEVTAGRCKLNGPWTDPTKDNMPRAIRALGAFSTHREVETASRHIYDTGGYISGVMELGLISIGKTPNSRLKGRFPNVMQIVWDDVTGFIFERFTTFERIKRGHPQWDLDGHLLWHMFQEHRGDKAAFTSSFLLTNASPTADEIAKYCQSRIYR